MPHPLNLFYQPLLQLLYSLNPYIYSINPSLHFACAYQVLSKVNVCHIIYKQYTVQLTLIVTRACMLCSFISVVTVGFTSEDFTVRENSTGASVEVCSNLPEWLTITRNVSVIVDVEQSEGEAEGQLNRHTWQSSLYYFHNNFNFLFLLQ